jgi:hypothetical protein
MKRLLLNSLLGCMLMSNLQLQAWWSPFSKKQWTIEDSISRKCFEVDDPIKQAQCIEVKLFLLQARKQELENSSPTAERIGSIIGGALVGLLSGNGAVSGAVEGLCDGHEKATRMQAEQDKIVPESIAFYERCKLDPSFLKNVPKEVLDRLEYCLQVPDWKKQELVKRMTDAWAAQVIGK